MMLRPRLELLTNNMAADLNTDKQALPPLLTKDLPSSSTPSTRVGSSNSNKPTSGVPYTTSNCGQRHSSRRSQLLRSYTMPLQTSGTSLCSRMPSFPPTLEEDSGSEQATQEQVQNISFPPTFHDESSSSLREGTNGTVLPIPYTSQLVHRNSGSTTASDSAASSPTVASLTDSMSNNDTPATSPDTPASSYSLYSPASSIASQLHNKHDSSKNQGPKDFVKPSAPAKRPRNLKNLAVDTSGAMAYGKPAATATLPLNGSRDTKISHPGPLSPAFVKPVKPPRRKASNLGLSIVTAPSSESPSTTTTQHAFPQVPQTPSLARPHALRHFPSSPALPLMSPRLPPEGGMKLPPLASRRSVSVGFSEVPAEEDEDRPQLQRFDLPESLDAKPDAYPDGPICIYDPHVYLYLAPTAKQASDFDVILNVANEIQNPFTTSESKPGDSTMAPVAKGPRSRRKSSDATVLGGPASTPTTPTASSHPSVSQPEYIHVPWEHNTDIVPDLYDLVKLIDDRVQQGKRVLIHCQCGVSRSASLIVAYGLYKNPSIAVQEAYDAVKRRSKWIGPNMSLIMQLQEFRSELLKSSAGMPQRHGKHKSKSKISFSRPMNDSLKHGSQQQIDDDSQRDEPRSAPLMSDNKQKAKMPLLLADHDKSVTPGPSSAPSGLSWPTDSNGKATSPAEAEKPVEGQAKSADATSTQFRSLRPAPAAVHENSRRPTQLVLRNQQTGNIPSNSSAENSLKSPTSEEFFMAPEKPLASDESVGLASPRPADVKPKPLNLSTSNERTSQPYQSFNGATADTLMSPRSAEFGMTSLDPPPQDSNDGFGLTSPRNSTFPVHLPHRPSFHVQSSKASAFSAIYPPTYNALRPSQCSASARAQFRSRLGMSTSSSYDMRSEYVLASRAQGLRRTSLISEGESPSDPSRLEVHEQADTLMSPRATEMARNPFEEALAEGPPVNLARGNSEGLAPVVKGTHGEEKQGEGDTTVDPRSPPMRGVAPIVRNIADVF